MLTTWTYIILAIPAILNLFSIWHAFTHTFPTPHERLIWVGVGVFVPLLGGIAYLLFGIRRTNKTNTSGV